MKRIIKVIIILSIIFILDILSINFYVIGSTKDQINVKNIKNIDCIIVLGAGV